MVTLAGCRSLRVGISVECGSKLYSRGATCPCLVYASLTSLYSAYPRPDSAINHQHLHSPTTGALILSSCTRLSLTKVRFCRLESEMLHRSDAYSTTTVGCLLLLCATRLSVLVQAGKLLHVSSATTYYNALSACICS